MNKGSVTVFLSLIMVLIISFLYTSLEGSRLIAANASLSYISQIAKTDFGAHYYYPLFKEYGLFAIDSGFNSTNYDEEQFSDLFNKYLTYPVDSSEGVILGFSEITGEISNVQNLYLDTVSGIRNQMKSQVLLEGAELVLNCFKEDSVINSFGDFSKVMEAQEEAAEAVGGISSELLKCISLIDGVKTGDTGVSFDKNGNIEAEQQFLKRLGINSSDYMQSTYSNSLIFKAVEYRIIYPDITGKVIFLCMDNLAQLDIEIASTENTLKDISDELSSLEQELTECLENNEDSADSEEMEQTEKSESSQILKLSNRIKELKLEEQRLSQHLSDLRENYYQQKETLRETYLVLQKVVLEAIDCSEKAISALEDLKIAQNDAKPSVQKFSQSINESTTLDNEVKKGFEDDATSMEKLVGIDNDHIAVMKQELRRNLNILYASRLPDYQESEMELVKQNVEKLMQAVEKLSYITLKFDYGEIRRGKNNGLDITEGLRECMSSGLLDLLGIDCVSEAKISNEDMVSMINTKPDSDIIDEFREMLETLSEGPASSFSQIFEAMTDEVISEIYITNHFSDYYSNDERTKIRYEREYILCGRETDKNNLSSTAQKIIVLRAVFCFAALMANSEKNAAATTLAYSIAGISGIAPVIYGLKYLILTVWAIQEAIVETAMLLNNKKVPLFSVKGNLEVHEILLFSKGLIAEKVTSCQGIIGASYRDYLSVLSFLIGNDKKIARILDLIQENMRLRYRDTFRVSNAVSYCDLQIKARLTPKFISGFFIDEAYLYSYDTSLKYD